jgi:hypothetical protein
MAKKKSETKKAPPKPKAPRKRVAKVWVASWVLHPVRKGLPIEIGKPLVVKDSKPDHRPINGGEWVHVKVTELPAWLR